MKTRIWFVGVALAAGLGTSSAAAAQHEGHQEAAQAGSATASAAECSRVQPGVTATIDATLQRLEAARQTNSATAMRAAVDDAQRALLDVRARLVPCASMQGAMGPHAGHLMPHAPNAPAAPAAPAAAAPAAPAAPATPAPAPEQPHQH